MALPTRKQRPNNWPTAIHLLTWKGFGIFGHSGGGFMSTAAMLVYPEFFKVAVSSSGNHDNAIYNRWWSEKHNGVKESIGEKGRYFLCVQH
jgi:enterochelin esterase-like enzyme